MIWSISWKNIWRNKVRSGVILAAIALGLTAGIFSSAFFTGMVNQRVEQAISNELSHIQIHHKDFRKTTELKFYMTGVDEKADSIKNIDHVTGVSKRIVIYSMVASAETAAGVKITGVIPEDERKVTGLHEKIIDGAYFEGVKRNPVVIGKKLAEKLKIKVRSKVVITLQDMDKNITGGAFRVVGIFETANTGFDENNIYVRYSDLSRLTDMPPDVCHEIAILIDDNNQTVAVDDQVKKMFPDLEVLNWKEISPEMSYLTEMMNLYNYIFIVIILFALLFGIINTMLMVVLERRKELGMLLAIGMSRVRVFMMIMLETVLLSLTGGVLGIILGGLVSGYFGKNPINLSRWTEGYSQLGYDTIVYTHIETDNYIVITIMVIITGIVAALYPAYKALKYDPAEALRIE
jgi:ABC-type lipoprotein release transport system permease subunit